MASLLVVTGPPGAGKSTVAALIARSYPRSVLVEGDAFFAFLDQGAIPPWLPESNSQNDVVTRAAGSATGQFVSHGYERSTTASSDRGFSQRSCRQPVSKPFTTRS